MQYSVRVPLALRRQGEFYPPLSLQGMSVGKAQAAASMFGFCCWDCVRQEILEPSGEGHLAKGCRNCVSCSASPAPCTPVAQS